MVVASLGFIGAGNIVKAVSRGLVGSKKFKYDNFWVSSPVASELEWVRKEGAKTTTRNEEVLANTDFVFLAVKPHLVPKVLGDLGSALTAKHMLVSVAAGVELKTLEAHAGPSKVTRIMLNTTVATCQGAAVYSLGKNCTSADSENVHHVLSSLGYTAEMPEKNLNAVSALLGSGPAYIYGVIEALADGAVYCGLGRKEAMELATCTVVGTGLNTQENLGKVHPAELRENVCSPGGTSICGVLELEKAAYKAAFMQAVISAYHKNIELGKQ